jgi:hypothetical protein
MIKYFIDYLLMCSSWNNIFMLFLFYVPPGVRVPQVENHCSRQSTHRWLWCYQPHAPAALYPEEDSWYSFLLEAWVDPRAIVRLEGLAQLKNPVTSWGIEPATFRLVAYATACSGIFWDSPLPSRSFPVHNSSFIRHYVVYRLRAS